MRIASRMLRSCRRAVLRFLETGIEAMARYPYDLSDLHWTLDLDPPPEDGPDYDNGGDWRYPGGPSAGRSIKLVPTPASQRYQAARPTRLPGRNRRPKQPV